MEQLNKAEIQAKIEAEIQKTRKLIEEYKEITRPIAPENAIGRISRMDAINNKSVAEAALRKAQQKLSKLEYALTKLNDENFGRCVKCHQIIPLGRLLLMPQSTRCVNCSQ